MNPSPGINAILDIRMLDHIIVAGKTGKMLSVKAEDMLPNIRQKD